MKLTQCPNCGRIAFSIDGKKVWVKLLPEEENALEVILSSEYLLAIVGGYEEHTDCCEECILSLSN